MARFRANRYCPGGACGYLFRTAEKSLPRIDARTALRSAALALFQERGYDRTTTTDIADRAGVTERTLFRHFPDKKEVLFDDEATGCHILVASIADAPTSLGAIDALFWALRRFEPELLARRSYTYPRFLIVSATPDLKERELTKQATLTAACASALEERGEQPLAAALAARIGMAAFAEAIEPWFADPECSYGERLDQSYGELRKLIG